MYRYLDWLDTGYPYITRYHTVSSSVLDPLESGTTSTVERDMEFCSLLPWYSRVHKVLEGGQRAAVPWRCPDSNHDWAVMSFPQPLPTLFSLRQNYQHVIAWWSSSEFDHISINLWPISLIVSPISIVSNCGYCYIVHFDWNVLSHSPLWVPHHDGFCVVV
jgi:hypothetical protein